MIKPQNHGKRNTTVRSFSLHTLATAKKGIKTFEPDRVCTEESCPTILSIYNKRATCYVHESRTPIQRRMPRSRGITPDNPNYMPIDQINERISNG